METYIAQRFCDNRIVSSKVSCVSFLNSLDAHIKLHIFIHASKEPGALKCVYTHGHILKQIKIPTVVIIPLKGSLLFKKPIILSGYNFHLSSIMIHSAC